MSQSVREDIHRLTAMLFQLPIQVESEASMSEKLKAIFAELRMRSVGAVIAL